MIEKTVNGSEKLKYMIDHLRRADGQPLTTSKLMDLLDCNRNTVNNYYNRCIASGVRVIKTKVGHETGYYLADSDLVYEPMTPEMVLKFLLMQKMKPGQSKKQNLLGTNYRYRDKIFNEFGSIGELRDTKYYEIINELIAEGELISINGKYYPGRNRIPVNWFLDEDEMVEYLNILTMLPPGYHSQNIVESVFNKINAVYESEQRDNDTYVVLGRTYRLSNRIHELISVLAKADYINNLIRIRYSNYPNDMVIAVGLVMYSIDKDKLYLIGKRIGGGTKQREKMKNMHQEPITESDIRNKTKDSTVFLDVEKIKDVSIERDANEMYHSKEFLDLYNRMFSIGNSKLVESEEKEIAIEFNNEEYIKERLINLCEYRSNTGVSLEEKDDKLIYRDHIIGAADFFNYLRQYTGKYTIIDSEPLRKLKADSLNAMLKEYTEGMR